MQLIGAPDQLLPLLVMDTLGKYPGMPGLFVAGIFSAALSSLSTCLNAMAAVVLEDFYRPFIKESLTEKQTSYLMRGVVLLVGIISTALVFVVAKLGTVLQLQMSIAGVTAGPVFGVFTMGVLMPWVKRKVHTFLFHHSSFCKRILIAGSFLWWRIWIDCDVLDLI